MLEDLTPPAKEFPCALRTIFFSLNETDAAILREALADKDGWSSPRLSKALLERGIPAGETLIRDRRERACVNCICR